MADSTATRVRDHAAHSPFWWLKIHGLPYYVFQRIDPTDSTRYGSAAWTLGSGYTARLALDTPSGQFSQKLPDLVGGIASAERITLKLNDFELFDSAGAYRFFGRMRSPARAFLSSAGIKWGRIEADIDPALAAGDTIYLRGPQGFAASGTLYANGETIGYSARTNNAPSAGVTAFTIAARNKFPAVDNFGGRTWPMQPWYIAPKDEHGQVQASATILFYDQPFSLIGRRCALYMGYIDGDGRPCAESDGLLRLAGRVGSLKRRGGSYEIDVESVVAELGAAKMAPTLARATIRPSQIIVPSDIRHRTFIVGLSVDDPTGHIAIFETAISIAADTYDSGDHTEVHSGVTTPGGICKAINAAIAAVFISKWKWAHPYVLCKSVLVNGEPRAAFVYRASSLAAKDGPGRPHLVIRNGVDPRLTARDDAVANDSTHSLLQALGFPEGNQDFVSGQPSDSGLDVGSEQAEAIIASGAMPSIYIPTVGVGIACDIAMSGTDAPGSRFFTDQGDGSGKAYVRFGDGQIVRVVDAVANRISTRARLGTTTEIGSFVAGGMGGAGARLAGGYYAVPVGSEATVEQVVVARGPGLPQESPAQMLGEFLASDGGANVAPGALNFYPHGVGLGLEGILDTDSWQMTLPPIGGRRFIVDKETTFLDYFLPIAKQCGLFVVWNQETGLISLRRIRIPSSGAFGGMMVTAYTFDESNRGRRDDLTDEDEDRSSMRTGWTVKTGWSATQDKFVGPTFKIDNYAPVIMYGIASKTEEIADKSVLPGAGLGQMLMQLIGARAVFFSTPWTRLTRAADKRYSLATPGDVVGPLVDRNATAPGGANGITAANAVYALLMGTSFNPATLDDGKVELLINPQIDPTRTKTLSPSGLIDFTKNDAGYTNGWDAVTKKLWMKRNYTGNTDLTSYDGIDFPVGRKVRITQLDLIGPPTVEHDTVAAVAADGQTVTLTTGFAAVSPTVESVLLCETFGAADAVALGSVAYQADAEDSGVGGAATLAFLWV